MRALAGPGPLRAPARCVSLTEVVAATRTFAPVLACLLAGELLSACLLGPNPDFTERVPSPGSSGDPASTSSSTSTGPAGSSSGTTGTPETSLGSSSGSGSGSSSASSGSVSGPCRDDVIDLAITPLDLVFVVDRSNDMTTPWDHDGDPGTAAVPRWSSARAALTVIAERFDASLFAGLALFPGADATMAYGPPSCLTEAQAEVPVGGGSAADIDAALPPADAALLGARPAILAFQAALAALAAGRPEARKKILFVAGGAWNCDPDAVSNAVLLEFLDDTLHGEVSQAFMDGIKTHVIGVGVPDATSPTKVDSLPDEVNAFTELGALATAGGTAKAGPEKFAAADDEAELVAALDAAVRDEFSCVVALDTEPTLPFDLVLELGGDPIPRITDCAGESGWHFVDGPPYTTIELCGLACSRFQELGAAQLFYFNCIQPG